MYACVRACVRAITPSHATIRHSTLTLTHRLKTSGSKRLQDSLLAKVGKGEEHRPTEAASRRELRDRKRSRGEAPASADESVGADAPAGAKAPAGADSGADAPASASALKGRGGKRTREDAAAIDVDGDTDTAAAAAAQPPAPSAATTTPAVATETPAVERLASSLEGFMQRVGASSLSGSVLSAKSDAQESPMFRAGLESEPSTEAELSDLRDRLRVEKENGEAQQRVRASIAMLPLCPCIALEPF